MSEAASPSASTSDASAGANVDDRTGASLEDRYGTGGRRRFDRRLVWGLGAAILLAGLSFMLWNNAKNTNHVEIVPISSGPMSDFEYEAKFTVTAAPNSLVACAVEALSPSKATVGWKVIELPFGEERTQDVTARLYTTAPATTAYANACWVVEE